jgi:hypothetical protein
MLSSSYSQKTNSVAQTSNTNVLPKSSFHMITQHNDNSGNVKFSGQFKDKIDEREKYLTAKYPNHQMVS